MLMITVVTDVRPQSYTYLHNASLLWQSYVHEGVFHTPLGRFSMLDISTVG